MGQLHVEGPNAGRVAAGAPLERPRAPGRRRGPVHAAHERARRDRRRPDRLPARAPTTTCSSSTPGTARRRTRGSRSGRSAAPRCATRPTSTGCSPCRGPMRSSGSGCRDAPAFTHAMGEVDGVEVMVCRTGYTGERGVELLCPAEDAVALWDAVVARGAAPCGLGARDTLRLEVCYPLHGNDITPDTDAISAGLGWTCALDKEFTGVAELRRIKDEGPGAASRRVRDGGEGDPAAGHADRRRRRGDLGHPLADARRRHRHGLRPRRERRARHGAHDRRARQADGERASSRSRSTQKEES